MKKILHPLLRSVFMPKATGETLAMLADGRISHLAVTPYHPHGDSAEIDYEVEVCGPIGPDGSPKWVHHTGRSDIPGSSHSRGEIPDFAARTEAHAPSALFWARLPLLIRVDIRRMKKGQTGLGGQLASPSFHLVEA